MRRLLMSRRAVSSMIGGIIILTLFLSALSVMVFISQQYDSYQRTVETMNQRDVDAYSENLVVIYPGLVGPNVTTNDPSGGGSCNRNTPCNMYSILISNDAAIGTQISRIYINSSSSGCVNLCTFDPAPVPTPLTFLESSAFVNPSEFKHEVIFYLTTDLTFTLPTAYGLNSISIVTTRGRVFSTQYPFPPTGVSTISYMVAGTMKIAYQPSLVGGYNSANEGTGDSAHGYCHENPTRVSGSGVPGGTLYFVNPWITQAIFDGYGGSAVGAAFPYNNNKNYTIMYVAVYAVYPNATQTITITGGSIWMEATMPGATQLGDGRLLYLGGSLIGLYYPWSGGPSAPSGVFYSAGSSPLMQGYPVLLIYRITSYSWGNPQLTQSFSDLTFTGMASVTNKREDGSYVGASMPLDGLYIRGSC